MVFAVRAPHFTVPVRMSMFERALPFMVKGRSGAPIFKARVELVPAAKDTIVDELAPFARFKVPFAFRPL
jgi:hypothetical protein